ncbi:hypothetical protein AQJ43_19385 [Streptomyces avermitilis]|uniref:Uncharacterized protein n=2 Tax=Streptomyces avermitilis TaxID=33903 RepID=Q826V0_STRAW|nr:MULTISPECIES: hypothetical protein [Streptomyces]KUN53149.1 hypothetical protein AQJ43_19385 [Streptomyces avermitilis]MYT02616.1 hypothetical protein [Streptomyces sp. SID5469]OOV11668.1 hypothetical protein SM007_41505 [Streptomyces avermitilis]BAC74786.1 hypothetical protein SAVERM_7075 [Streptomyces avermitilis MA-4680 = NBRC 14893]GDY67353.1 hypothetical protein SAV14893_067460 [Streptomyces avermitilis]
MTIEQCLATIDLLCARPFPAEHGRTDVGSGGPGYHIAELGTSDGYGAEDCWDRAETAEECYERGEEVRDQLTGRWGPSDHIGLQTVQLRTETEDIPEPWVHLSARVGDIHLWRTEGNGRWIALGVADRDEADEIRLLVVVTEIDPP